MARWKRLRRWLAKSTRLVAGGLALLPACAGNTPEAAVKKFCEHNARPDRAAAWAMLTNRDRNELSQTDYIKYQWDQERFDMRILRSHDTCLTESLAAGEQGGLYQLKIPSVDGDRAFSCAVPVVREDNQWRVSRHFEAAETLIAARDKARKELALDMADARAKADEAYLESARNAFKEYWDAIDVATDKLKQAGNGVVPVFCEPTLNLDGGKDLAYLYMAIQAQEETSQKPRHVQKKEEQYAELTDILRQPYRPLHTMMVEGARVDLVHSAWATVDGVPQIHNVFAIWGDTKSRFDWRLDVYAQNKLTNEGTGSLLEVTDDIDKVNPLAPKARLLAFDSPKMPAGTDRLELQLWEQDSERDYVVPLPLKPEYIAAAN
jgi:hypothetical protein